VFDKAHLVVVAAVLLALAGGPAGGAAAEENPGVVLTTSLGEIEIELYPDKAPKSVENFLSYVDDGFYDGTVFHRVIPGFMIQCGGMTADMGRKPTKAAIENEADNGLDNDAGTLAMARTQAKDSATSQFFINVKDNDLLNHSAGTIGYAVFGRVVDGMDVVKKIEAVPTVTRARHQNVPSTPVVIESARRK
jgi:peptidyl-prolyl cis-trans isomerase A (cyclophilin A)